jgi:hypothetical protein
LDFFFFHARTDYTTKRKKKHKKRTEHGANTNTLKKTESETEKGMEKDRRTGEEGSYKKQITETKTKKETE